MGRVRAKPVGDDRQQRENTAFAMVIALDNPTSNVTTRRIHGWEPTHPGLIADFENGDYFTTPSSHS